MPPVCAMGFVSLVHLFSLSASLYWGLKSSKEFGGGEPEGGYGLDKGLSRQLISFVNFRVITGQEENGNHPCFLSPSLSKQSLSVFSSTHGPLEILSVLPLCIPATAPQHHLCCFGHITTFP